MIEGEARRKRHCNPPSRNKARGKMANVKTIFPFSPFAYRTLIAAICMPASSPVSASGISVHPAIYR